MTKHLNCLTRIAACMAVFYPLAACQTSGTTPGDIPLMAVMKDVTPYPPVQFKNRPPLFLKANSLEIESEYMPAFAPPFVEHLFPVPPEHIARKWASERIKTVGGDVVGARFVIRQADVTETQVSGEKKMMDTPRGEKYKATLEMALQIIDDANNVLAEASANAWVSRTLDDSASIAERENAWYDMANRLADAIDTKMTATVQQYLKNYIRTAPTSAIDTQVTGQDAQVTASDKPAQITTEPPATDATVTAPPTGLLADEMAQPIAGPPQSE